MRSESNVVMLVPRREDPKLLALETQAQMLRLWLASVERRIVRRRKKLGIKS